jgi:hypothetical protein
MSCEPRGGVVWRMVLTIGGYGPGIGPGAKRCQLEALRGGAVEVLCAFAEHFAGARSLSQM